MDDKKRGRPAFEEYTCDVANIWTSKGKLLKGESAKLDPKEVEQLRAAEKGIRK